MDKIDTQDMFEEPKPEKKKKKTNAPVAVYLTAKEKIEIKELADQAGVTRHSLLQYAVRYFISAYKKDKKILKTKTETMLDMP